MTAAVLGAQGDVMSVPASVATSAQASSAAADALLPAQRLASSRELMRQAMWAHAHPQHARAASAAAGGRAQRWWQALKSTPGAGAIVDTVVAWWARHPLRPVVAVASEAGRAVVLPVAQRHPLALVCGAVLVGGVLVKTRAWRWLLKPAWFAGLVPLLAGSLIERMPLESWLGLVAQLGSPPRAQAAAAVDAAAQPPA